jgi:hypothetical protein
MGAIGGKVKGGFQQDGGRAAQNPPDSAFCDIAGRVFRCLPDFPD